MIRIFKKGETGKKIDLFFKIIFKRLESIKYPWAMPKPPRGGGGGGGGLVSFLLGALIKDYIKFWGI